MERRKSAVRLKPGERQTKTLEDCLADLKRAIERGAKRYRNSRSRATAEVD